MEQRMGDKGREVRQGEKDGIQETETLDREQRAGKQGTGDEKEISFILSFWSFSLHRKLFFSDHFDR